MTSVHYVNDSKLRVSRVFAYTHVLKIFYEERNNCELSPRSPQRDLNSFSITRTYVKLFVSILGTYEFQFIDDDRSLTIPLYLSQRLYD